MAPITPHFSTHFELGLRGSKVVEQHSEGDLIAQVFNVLVCPQYFRDDLPEFGRPELLFSHVPLDLAAIQAAVERWSGAGVALTEAQGAFEVALREVLVEVEGAGT